MNFFVLFDVITGVGLMLCFGTSSINSFKKFVSEKSLSGIKVG